MKATFRRHLENETTMQAHPAAARAFSVQNVAFARNLYVGVTSAATPWMAFNPSSGAGLAMTGM